MEILEPSFVRARLKHIDKAGDGGDHGDDDDSEY